MSAAQLPGDLGIRRSFGVRIGAFHLKENGGSAPEVNELKGVVSEKKLIALPS